jgi:hypothetical protein
MRKLITLLIVVLFSVSIHAQKISFDRIEKGGVRHIGTKRIVTKVEKATYNFSLTVFSSGLSSKDYCLLISSIWKIEKDCIVMVKLGNDETVKLIANNLNVGEIDWPTYNPIIGGKPFTGVLSTKKANYYVSLFSLENDLLEKIEKFGIEKIRISFGNTYFEKNWTNNRLGKYIKKCHEKLESQLQKNINSMKSIEDGF